MCTNHAFSSLSILRHRLRLLRSYGAIEEVTVRLLVNAEECRMSHSRLELSIENLSEVCMGHSFWHEVVIIEAHDCRSPDASQLLVLRDAHLSASAALKLDL